MFELVIILLSFSKMFPGCCDCCPNCCLRVEKDGDKVEKRKIDLYKKPGLPIDKKIARKKIWINDINVSIFTTLARKKLYFSDEDRRAPGFKRFKFLKNCFPNGGNRCWLISEIMLFGNSPFQEIILDNDVSDNIYLDTLKKLFIKMREENNKKTYLNCDELIELIDSRTGRDGGFCFPFYHCESTFQTHRRKKYTCLLYDNIFSVIIKCSQELRSKVDIKKIRNLDPLLYSVEKSSGYCIDLVDCTKNSDSDGNFKMDIYSRPMQERVDYQYFVPLIMYFYEDEQTEKEFLDIINRRDFIKRKIFKSEDELYGFYGEMLSDIKGNFEFFCNGVILESIGYHFFAICHNEQDNNWYNFNSLDGYNGDVCDDLVNDLIKNKEIKIKGHKYIPSLFLITVRRKR